MKNRKTSRWNLGAAAGALAFAAVTLAPMVPAQATPLAHKADKPAAVAPLPAEHEADGIAYVTGGVARDQAEAFKHGMKEYPLAIQLLERKPHSLLQKEATANAQVRITQENGHQVFQARADGPYMLVKLPPGRYDVTASLGNRTLEKKHVEVKPGHSKHETFVFPSGTA